MSSLHRGAGQRPVLAREDVMSVCQRVIRMTSADMVAVAVRHTAHVVTRLANDRVVSSDDGSSLWIWLDAKFGGRGGAMIGTNQLDDTVLLAAVRRCEALSRESLGVDPDLIAGGPQMQDMLVPTALWHDTTVQAMTTTRGTVIPDVLGAVAGAGLRAAGFLGMMARSEAFLTKAGISAYSEETDSELTVTARTPDGKGSGWGGDAARDWLRVRPLDVAARAVTMAQRSANPSALEPGRRTAILSATAVAQMLRFLSPQFHAENTDHGRTALSKSRRGGNKLGRPVVDARLTMRSDPADADGGYSPYFDRGYGTPAMTWIEKGVLTNLAYTPSYAMARGKAYAALPRSLRVSGGTTSVDEMIAQCDEGVYVNQLSGVELVDDSTGLLTGVTRDGCFFVKNGRIERPVKNFRFLESPFFFLNKIKALGPSHRAAFGYTPPSRGEQEEWPRAPMIVPAMMVGDFNFNALADAV
jgi:predicted Zn-dependent protease